MKSSTHSIKREQKKSFYLQKLTELVHRLSEDEAALREVYISRIDLSADTGICYVYFATCSHQTDDALTIFKNALDILKLYKPSLRKAFAQIIRARYTPDLMFMFDEKQETVRQINSLLDKVQHELPAEQDTTDTEDE